MAWERIDFRMDSQHEGSATGRRLLYLSLGLHYLLHWQLAAFVYCGSWLHEGELVSWPCHPCHVGGKHLKDELEEILPLFCLAFLSQQQRSLTNVDEALSHAIQAVLHCN